MLVQAAGTARAVDAAGDQAGALQHLQVTLDGGLRHVKRFGQLHDRGFAKGQPRQDGAAGGVGQGEEGGVEGLHNSLFI